MDFKIVKVTDKKGLMKFIKSQWLFYLNDPLWVPPMIADRKKTLDTEKNPFYKHSKLQLFLAESNNTIVGRIAAIINDNHNKTHNDKVGFFGFFECIDNQEIANGLFDAASEWLLSYGMDTMRGPINPSMNDEIGLLIDGFDSSPLILMTYNPAYYVDLHENAGLKKAKDVFAYLLKPESYRTDKIRRFQNIIRERYKVTIREMNLKDKVQLKKDINILKEIYNAAWVPNWGFVKWTDEEFDFIANDIKQIADQRLAIIAESNGKVAGFALSLPDINQVLKYNKNGSLIGALWHLLTKKKTINMIRIIALGIIPEFQGKGIDAVLYFETGERGVNNGYYTGEASWILEDNEMMNRGLSTTMNAHVYKTYRIYERKI